jgi:acetyl esterase/lipase
MKRTVSADSTALAVQAAVTAQLGRNRPINSSVPAKEPSAQVGEDGVLYKNDLRYGSDFPNSFLDIWYPDEDLSTPRPVLVYFHGGGFLFGDKVTGDPLAANPQDGVKSSIAGFLQDGFCVVCPEYAFAPEHRYPDQLHQVNQVLDHLQKHREEYALDTDRIVLMGGSAGADLVEIYGLIVADERYAQTVGVTPVVSPNQIRALIIDEAALTARGVTDNNMKTLFQVWLGEEDLETGEFARQIDVPVHIDGAYIPAFINSSNLQAWFWRSAEDLRSTLAQQSLPHEYFYVDQSIEALEHGYVNRHQTNAVARDCYERMRSFARSASGLV